MREKLAREEYENAKINFEDRLKDCGYVLKDSEIHLYEPDNFDEVKALDLHHLTYDFPQDIVISGYNINNFTEIAEKRKQAFDKAQEYLTKTHQEEYIKDLPKRDVEIMYEFAKRIGNTGTLKSTRSDSELIHRSNTFKIDKSYSELIRRSVNNVLEYEN